MVEQRKEIDPVDQSISNLHRLQLLTEALPPLEDFIRMTDRSTDTVEFKVADGLCYGRCLRSRPEIEIMESYMSKGSTFPIHVHDDSIELLIVFKGQLSVRRRSCPEGRIVKVGEIARFEKGEPHTITAEDETWLIGITIPKGYGFPDDRKE